MSAAAAPKEHSSSVYITFKVFQLVNQIRTSLKTRVRSNKAASNPLGSEFLNKFERHATRGIEEILSRTSSRRRAKSRCELRAGVSRKGKSDVRPWKEPPKETTTTSVQQLVEEVEAQLSLSKLPSTLTKLSVDDEAFLSHKAQPVLDHLSWVDIARLLAVVEDALDLVHHVTGKHGRLLCSGTEVQSWDEVFLANLEHLLLCLRWTLNQALIRKTVNIAQEQGLYWKKYHETQRRLCDNWFSEFPNNRHPLSTTWPWSIRPSLAVLWGVCWMFYDRPQGNPVSEEDLDEWYNTNFVATTSPGGPPGWPASHVPHRQIGNAQTPTPTNAQIRSASNGSNLVFQNNPAAAPAQINSAAWSRSSIYASSRPPPHQVPLVPSPTDFCLRPSATALHPTHPPRSRNPYAATLQQQPLPQPQTFHSPHRPVDPGHLTGPSVALTLPVAPGVTSYVARGGAAPVGPAPGPGFSYGRHSPQATTPNMNNLNFATSSTLQEPYYHQQQQRPAQNPSSMTRSPVTPISMAEEQQIDREDHERRLSHSSNHSAPTFVQRRDDSAEIDDALSPGRGHAFKRNEDAPRNPEGKMVCKYPECGHLIFERRCEWSKHMDKHDRPYKCNAPGCEKLQGFTYSGGLLRHQREVHKMHGGTKQPLFCPEKTCKRHTGQGFTRKENLAEHMRRVHRQASGASEVSTGAIREDAQQPVQWPGPVDSPPQLTSYPENDAVSAKRKHSFGQDSVGTEEGDVREMVKRLKKENEDKDAELTEMKDRIKKMEEMIATMHAVQKTS